MANINRFDPFRELARFPFSESESWFHWPSLRPVVRELTVEPQIRMDVKEADNEYRVKADIPGVSKEDIRVSVDGNLVSISAEIKKEKEEKEGERVIRSERSYGMASRSFTLDSEIDAGKVKASYTDGVLEIVLPKKSGSAGREITVS